MNDTELAAKMFIAFASFVAIVMLGQVMIFVGAPLFVIGCVIDTILRGKYNSNLALLKREAGKTVAQPAISSFDARCHEGKVVVAWLVDLPEGATLDIYRSFDTPGGSHEDVQDFATCVHSTSLDFTNTIDDAFIDHGAREGVQYYIPVIAGLHVSKTPIPYSFFSFSTSVQFTTKKVRVNARGDAVRVELKPHVEREIIDGRDDATKATDEILVAIHERKKRDASLDAAIARIRENANLTDEEKDEAIELLETRIGAQ